MQVDNKAARINQFDFTTPQMRAFHMSWFAFFLCLFAWFGIAPLMTVVREEMDLTDSQVGWCIIGSGALTFLGRLLIGWLCDRIGPRLSYTWLLILGSLPVMGIGFAHNFETLLLFRLLIGLIGASFVITQYHTSVMFAPNCVGTANAMTAGWGNLGGGVTQFAMPVGFSLLVGTVGVSAFWGWRLSMMIVGVGCLLTGVAYFFLTQDTPNGNFKDLRAAENMPDKKAARGSLAAAGDPRVWALFGIYGTCFGIELTVNNIAAMYFRDCFATFQQMELEDAVFWTGLAAFACGGMNIFARPFGGMISDRFGSRWGLSGRVKWLFAAVFCEGLALMVFSQIKTVTLAIPMLMVFAILVQMANGATFSIVPFVNRKALGSVAGIVGAGGNAGAIAAGFLFMGTLSWPTALLVLGVAVTASSFLAFAVRFSSEAEGEAQTAIRTALQGRREELELAGATSAVG